MDVFPAYSTAIRRASRVSMRGLAVVWFVALAARVAAGACLPPFTDLPAGSARYYNEYLLTFPSPGQPLNPPNGTAYVEYFVPKTGIPAPAVVLLHSWGTEKAGVERRLAAALARNGIATAMLVMPYHMQRTPPGEASGALMISDNVPRSVDALEQAVQETHVLFEWLSTRPEIDHAHIGLCGISLGAMVGALALGQLHDFHSAVLILGGADFSDILWRSPLLFEVRRGLRRKGITAQQLSDDLRGVEPLNFLKPYPPGSVYMINGIYDPIVPHADTMALWRALGRPESTWLDTGHYMPPWGRLGALKLTTDYFRYRFFGGKPFVPPRHVALPRVMIGVFLGKAPTVAIGAGVELLKAGEFPVTIDGDLSTGGLSFGPALNLGKNWTVGLQRKLFASDRRFSPYVLVSITL